MEDHPTTDATLDLYRRHAYQEGLNNVGVVIQSYLYRSEGISTVDRRRRTFGCAKGHMPNRLRWPIRKTGRRCQLSEPVAPTAPVPGLAPGCVPAFATHDPAMIDDIKRYAHKQEPIDPSRFQMLFGIRRDLQESLAREGYRVRIYVPYGTAWYPYFVRRLAERPANIWFFVSNFFRA